MHGFASCIASPSLPLFHSTPRELQRRSRGHQPPPWPGDLWNSGDDVTKVGKTSQGSPVLVYCMLLFLDDPSWSVD